MRYSENDPVKARLFNLYKAANNVDEDIPLDYDYLGAFQNGVMRGPGQQGHFPDTYKLPTHESFSNESKYYKPGMPAVQWVGDKNTPVTGERSLDRLLRNRHRT